MKKLLLTSFLITGLLLPATFQASNNESSNKLEFLSSKTKKKKKKRKSRRKSRRTTASNNGCTYQGHKLYVGERGGCYYYSGNSKEYVERSYCSGCR